MSGGKVPDRTVAAMILARLEWPDIGEILLCGPRHWPARTRSSLPIHFEAQPCQSRRRAMTSPAMMTARDTNKRMREARALIWGETPRRTLE